jgi:DNA-binding NtrC family response regulator
LTVEAFQDGNDALASLDHRHPAVIFLDVALLQSDALDVIRGLGDRAYGGVVQLMSGGRPALLDAVRRIGLRHRMKLATPLQKPFARDAIVQLVVSMRDTNACAAADGTLPANGA